MAFITIFSIFDSARRESFFKNGDEASVSVSAAGKQVPADDWFISFKRWDELKQLLKNPYDVIQLENALDGQGKYPNNEEFNDIIVALGCKTEVKTASEVRYWKSDFSGYYAVECLSDGKPDRVVDLLRLAQGIVNSEKLSDINVINIILHDKDIPDPKYHRDMQLAYSSDLKKWIEYAGCKREARVLFFKHQTNGVLDVLKKTDWTIDALNASVSALFSELKDSHEKKELMRKQWLSRKPKLL